MRRAEVLWGRKTALLLRKKQTSRRIFHSKTRLNTSKHATAHHWKCIWTAILFRKRTSSRDYGLGRVRTSSRDIYSWAIPRS